jgi:hypothetical protein
MKIEVVLYENVITTSGLNILSDVGVKGLKKAMESFDHN